MYIETQFDDKPESCLGKGLQQGTKDSKDLATSSQVSSLLSTRSVPIAMRSSECALVFS